MAVFRETYYIYLRNLKVWFMPATFLPPLFISGVLYVLFAATFAEVTQLGGFATGDYDAFLVAWIIVQAVVFSGGDSGFALLTDVMSGYFDKLLLAPINRFSILFGSLLVSGTRAMFQGVVIVVIALALGSVLQDGCIGCAGTAGLRCRVRSGVGLSEHYHCVEDKKCPGNPVVLCVVFPLRVSDHGLHAGGASQRLVQDCGKGQPGDLRYGGHAGNSSGGLGDGNDTDRPLGNGGHGGGAAGCDYVAV